MEGVVLKQILDVVVDIKADQKEMKKDIAQIKAKQDVMEAKQDSMQAKQDSMQAKQDNMEKKLDNIEIKVEKLTTEQLIMKQQITELQKDTKLLNFNMNRLLREQEDTKNIIVYHTQKLGELY